MSELALPRTDTPPDNTYFDSQVVSWNFAVDGQKATLGFIQPEFNKEFTAAEGGEHIILEKPEEGTRLSILELGGKNQNKVEGVHVLEKEGDEVFIPGGKRMQIQTAAKVVEYVCIYPGQPAEG